MKTRLSLKILALLALAFLFSSRGLSGQTLTLAEADGLLNSPKLDFAQARQALDHYEALLPLESGERGPLLTRLTRVSFILGDLAPASQRQKYYEKGKSYAELLLREEPAGVAGRYWLALNLCGLADVGGSRQGHKLLPRILEELKNVLARDETYDQAGAHRVLGRIYYEAPSWPLSVGDLQKSLRHLKAAVRLAPENSTNHLYLAETLLRLGETSQARQELESVLKASRHAVWPQGLEDDRREAWYLLQDLGEGTGNKAGSPPLPAAPGG